MFKVMLVEDEESIRHILKKMIEKVDGFEVVAEADTFATALREFAEYKPDVVFVDVDLNGDSGLECAKVMVNLNPDLKVVFATAHSEYMANAFEIYAFDYLVKPFDMERLHKTLNRMKDTPSLGKKEEIPPQSVEGENDKLLIKGKDQVYFVGKNEIIMIERFDHQTVIYTAEETYKTSVSLSDLEEKLPAGFMRSHKSYLINTGMITKIEPYGRWTYVVKFKGFTETALITSAKYDELKARFE